MKERSETSAGGVVVRRVDGDFEVAVAEQRDRLTGSATLRLPKGKVQPGERPERTARREVDEEAGVQAQVIAPLGTVNYAYREGEVRVAKQVHFFLMELACGELHPRDGEMQRVYWCPIDEAAHRLSFETERRVVERARQQLAGGAKR